MLVLPLSVYTGFNFMFHSGGGLVRSLSFARAGLLNTMTRSFKSHRKHAAQNGGGGRDRDGDGSEGKNNPTLTDDDTIKVDKFKLAQVMRNLVSNALKFIPRNGNGEVEIRAVFVPDEKSYEEFLIATTSDKVGKAMRVFQNLMSASLSNRNEKPADASDAGQYHDKEGNNAAVPRHGYRKQMSVNKWIRSKSFFASSRKAVAPNDLCHEIPVPRKPGTTRGKLQITVKDNGVGISPENQKRLFTEIVQFNPEVLQAGGGSGMGLLIAKGIVDLHGGAMSVFSEGEGKGCTFTVEIPMERKSRPSVSISARPAGGSVRAAAAVEVPPERPHQDQDRDRTSVLRGHALRRSVRAQQLRRSSQIAGAVHLNSNVSSHHENKSVKDGHEGAPVEVGPQYAVADNHLPQLEMEDLISLAESAQKMMPCPGSDECEPEASDKIQLDTSHALAVTGACNIEAVDGSADKAVAAAAIGQERPEPETSAVAVGAMSEFINAATGFTLRTPIEDFRAQDISARVTPVRSPRSIRNSVAGTIVSAREVYDGPLYNVLIVDDSDLTRKMLRKTLQAVGHTCDEAEDGLVAVEKIKNMISSSVASDAGNALYDCILMDFVMPNLDGPSATRQIRNLGYTGPIFGVTGNNVDSDIQMFLKAGASKVFPKPFVLKNFHDSMPSFMDERDLRVPRKIT
jgi:CheY-like chemotaxis protein